VSVSVGVCVCVSVYVSLCMCLCVGLWGCQAGKCRRFHPSVSGRLRHSAGWARCDGVWWSEAEDCYRPSSAQEPFHSHTGWSHEVSYCCTLYQLCVCFNNIRLKHNNMNIT